MLAMSCLTKKLVPAETENFGASQDPAAFSGRLQFGIPIFSAKEHTSRRSLFLLFSFGIDVHPVNEYLKCFAIVEMRYTAFPFILREASYTFRIYFPGRNTSPESLIVAPPG